jgi:hypothetical protein
MGNRFIPDRDTPTGGTGEPMLPREREFDAGENVVIGGLATWMGVVGMFTIVIGTLQTVLGALTFKSTADVLSVGQGVLMMVVGGLLWGASRSFREIVRTRNNDIGHLMTALGKLRSAYTIQGVVLITVTAIVAVMVFLAVGGRSG